MKLRRHPCSTCPYSRATPPGIWDGGEYEKLPEYDEGGMASAPFACHHDDGHVCKGWLDVHRWNGFAVRLGLMTGALDSECADAEPSPGLYATGAEAAAVGLAGVEHPDDQARRAMDRLEALRGWE